MSEQNISIKTVDDGREFNWGKSSRDYAKYRDVYPEEFYQYIVKLGLCVKGQSVLDVGTGTGVLPRNMYPYGAKWTGTDISENQIAEAKALAKAAGMEIDFYTADAKAVDYPDGTFDVITACQCIWYLDHQNTAPCFAKLLKAGGSFLILYMGWLPFEDEIAGKSEKLILKYNPKWTGHSDTVHPVPVPEEYLQYFSVEKREEFRVDVPFTRDGWHGRMRACRGTGASMTSEELALWDSEHRKMLEKYPETFMVKHYVSVAWLKKEEKNSMIIYGSRYGTAEQYAKKLSELMKVPALSYEEVTDPNQYRRIIYIGALYAGGVLGMKKTLRTISDLDEKQITIATVGLADPDDADNIASIRRSMSKQLSPELFRKAEIFHLRGGIDYAKLGFKDKTMMAMLYKKAYNLPEEKKTADARALVETYNQKVNFVDFDRLKNLIQ